MCSLPRREPPAPGSCTVDPDSSLFSSDAKTLSVSAAQRVLRSLHPAPCCSKSSLTPLLWQPPCTGISSSLPHWQPAADLQWVSSPHPVPVCLLVVLRRKANTAPSAQHMHSVYHPPTSWSILVFLHPTVSSAGSSSTTGTCRAR